MKVFLQPTGLYSHAMLRVAAALERYAPDPIEVTRNADQADFRVIHAIGPGLFHGVDENQPHAIIQYCLESAGYDALRWSLIWQRAQLVWSYYDLVPRGGGQLFEFYHAPLGVDDAFVRATPNGQKRPIGAMSSGYVSGPSAEAIEEVALAAHAVGIPVVHLGPQSVEGMKARPANWSAVIGISDVELADLYLHTEWVSGLRHVEGFELPALEGLMCGARPFVFDRPDMHQWYDEHAVFVPECCGEPLIAELTELFRHKPVGVSDAERAKIADTFNWERIATGFWERLL